MGRAKRMPWRDKEGLLGGRLVRSLWGSQATGRGEPARQDTCTHP